MLRMLFRKPPTPSTVSICSSCRRFMLHKGSQVSTIAQSIGSASASVEQASDRAKPRIIILTGPTAVGKTKIGLALAKQLNGEIISADSVQVYKGLDIGSDKLPEHQREGIPHHLLDILPPDAEFSAGDFHHRGRQAAEDIIARGKTPIVVGGTGFYLRWFIFGKAQTPPSNPETAAKAQQLIQQAWLAAAGAPQKQHEQQQDNLVSPPQQQHVEPQQQGGDQGGQNGVIPQQQQQQQQQAESGVMNAEVKIPPAAAGLTEEQRWNAAVDVIQQLGDPHTAARVRSERNNWYRLQRVIQILLQNGGRPLSEMDIDRTQPLDYDFRCFFLHRDRIELYDRITQRVEEMVASGLLSEALMLLDMGMKPNSHIATKAIGYRQACEFMQTALADGGATKQQLHELIVKIASASRNLVKNQTTWFRDDSMFRWIDVNHRSTGDILGELQTELSKSHHEGGCGDSGRLDKQQKRALKGYVTGIKLFKDDEKVDEVLNWIKETVASRQDCNPGS